MVSNYNNEFIVNHTFAVTRDKCAYHRDLSGCDETTSLIAALYMPNGLMIRILFQYTSPCQQPSLKQLVFLLTTFSFNSGLGVSARSQQGFTVGRRTARLDAPNIVTKL